MDNKNSSFKKSNFQNKIPSKNFPSLAETIGNYSMIRMQCVSTPTIQRRVTVGGEEITDEAPVLIQLPNLTPQNIITLTQLIAFPENEYKFEDYNRLSDYLIKVELHTDKTRDVVTNRTYGKISATKLKTTSNAHLDEEEPWFSTTSITYDASNMKIVTPVHNAVREKIFGNTVNCWTSIVKAALDTQLINIETATKCCMMIPGDEFMNIHLLKSAKKYTLTGTPDDNTFINTIPRGHIVSFEVSRDMLAHVMLCTGNGMALEIDKSAAGAVLRGERNIAEILTRYSTATGLWYGEPPWNSKAAVPEAE